jgi:sugar phosphate permease
MSATLATVYCTVMGAKCALPAALSLLANPETGGLQFAGAADPQKAFSALFFRSTLAVAAGKLLLGPIIDRMGGIRSLQIALLILASNLLFISMCHSFSTFAASWIAVDFVFSSCWAACIHAIHQCFPPNEWARQISRVAAASRLGNALAFAGFASVLQLCARERVVQPWRHLFAISGFTQLLPVAMLTAFGGGRRRSQESMGGGSDDDLSAGQAQRKARRPLWVLRREMGRVDFWLHLASRSVLMVYASFLLFVPTLMSQVYGANPATASRVGSLYAAGCLTAVTLGSDRYGKLRHQPRAKAATLAALLGASMAASTLHLGHACGWWTLGVPAASLAMLLWGLSFAIPFYIPPSLYALERGGVESSATIADAFDVAGFGLLAAFNGYVAGIRHGARAAWIPTFSATTACAAISLLSLVAVELREPPQKSKL